VQKAFLASRRIRPPRKWELCSAWRATLNVCQRNGSKKRRDRTLRRVTETNAILHSTVSYRAGSTSTALPIEQTQSNLLPFSSPVREGLSQYQRAGHRL